MRRFWICHWQFKFWRPDVNAESRPIRKSAGNLYTKRGILGGGDHSAYIVSLSAGQLYLGGRMAVSQVLTRAAAMRLWKRKTLFPAAEWLVDDTTAGGTPLHLHRRLAPEVTRKIECVMANGEVKGLFFDSKTHLNVQATRGVRELTQESATLLDRIISITDSMPRTGKLVTVTNSMIRDGESLDNTSEFRLPEEMPESEKYSEGAVCRVNVNRFERSPEARAACIAFHGTTCCICGFDFVAVYGEVAKGYIHVHHLRPLSQGREVCDVDPVEDLRPICPNCHAVVHLNGACRSIEEVERLLQHNAR